MPISKRHSDRVVVWPIGPGGDLSCTVLVYEKNRPNSKCKGPSGSIEYDPKRGRFETPEEAGMRETKEETGLDVILTRRNLIQSYFKVSKVKANYGYTIFNFVVEVPNFKQLRRQGKTGERTIRYPLRRLPYLLDTKLPPRKKKWLRGREILKDDLDFLERVTRAKVFSPMGLIYRFEPGYIAA